MTATVYFGKVTTDFSYNLLNIKIVGIMIQDFGNHAWALDLSHASTIHQYKVTIKQCYSNNILMHCSMHV